MVGISTVIILAIAVYNWAVTPQTGYLHAAKQYEQIMDDSKKKMMSMKTQIAVDNKKKVELTSEIEYIQNRIFTLDNAAQFFSSLKDIAQQNGASLLSFNYISNVTSSKKRLVPINAVAVETKTARLNIKGTYAGIRSFMNALEKYSEDIAILELNISSEMDNRDNMLNCDIILNIYILTETENNPNE